MLRILLVDDSEDSRLLALTLLKKMPFEVDVDVAVDGAGALELLAAEEAYDLVLLDMQMPGMDGFETVRELRQRESAKGGRLPVVAVTAYDRPEDRRRVLEAGCDDHLGKPLRRAELYDAIRRRIPWVEPLLSSSAEELVPRYLKTRVEEIPQLEHAYAAGDWPTCAALAHRLRGLSGYDGLDRLQAMGSELESAALAGDGARVGMLLPPLLEYLKKIEQEARI